MIRTPRYASNAAHQLYKILRNSLYESKNIPHWKKSSTIYQLVHQHKNLSKSLTDYRHHNVKYSLGKLDIILYTPLIDKKNLDLAM